MQELGSFIISLQKLLTDWGIALRLSLGLVGTVVETVPENGFIFPMLLTRDNYKGKGFLLTSPALRDALFKRRCFQYV
jgi:hypothetical protein